MPVRKMAGSHKRVMEGSVVRGKKDQRLSCEASYKEMAQEREDWSDFESTVADGLGRREKRRARTK